MVQPKLAITNKEIAANFDLKISANKTESDLVIVAIGDAAETKSGELQVPVKLAQATSRFNKGQDFAAIARGWNADRILTHVESFTPSRLKDMKLKEGSTFADFCISVEYTTEPTYDKQTRMVTPDGEVITANGVDVYRTTSITKGVKDKNVENLVFDTVDTQEYVKN